MCAWARLRSNGSARFHLVGRPGVLASVPRQSLAATVRAPHILVAWATLSALLCCGRPVHAVQLPGVPAAAVEIAGKRTREAKHFHLPDGRNVAVVSAAPLHY